ncbi:hypothetical protein PAERUG_E15_London_28_01_14_02809 [Pseudomonas aeruginosa]|nr:hypothetical protein PAERUG_E15_London_28_01_14_02809 [Pseudomonas aeruginosa]CRR22560.1 hypothetical protein PAERUG_E16_London_17_VIM_2_04_14_04700 [Pseudomonas aeruginosa]
MQNQVSRNTATDQPNQMPDMAMGRENIPAPTAVPAMIIEPPSSEGRRLGV